MTAAREVVFMMGLPAAGKSTVSKRSYPNHVRLDPDEIKATLPGYVPALASQFHDESMRLFEIAFDSMLASTSGNYVIDGTGTNSDRMVRMIRDAQGVGFVTRLVYVTCSLQTSLKRAAARARIVPPEIIRDKARNIATAFEIVAGYADSVQVIHNDESKGNQ